MKRNKRNLILLLGLTLLAVLVGFCAVWSQTPALPTPTATSTFIPPTHPPTLQWTPTYTPTLPATATATSSPTATDTPQPSFTPTDAPTITPPSEPTMAVLPSPIPTIQPGRPTTIPKTGGEGPSGAEMTIALIVGLVMVAWGFDAARLADESNSPIE